MMLSQSYAPVIGGIERVVQDLSRELARRGHTVTVATLTQGAETGADGIRIHRLRSTADRLPRGRRDSDRTHAMPGPDPETVIDLARVLKLERPEIVHGHDWMVHSFVPLRSRSRVPLVVSLHDYDLLCATKRLFRRGEVCTGPGLIKCVECAGRQFGRPVGAGVALGLRAAAPRLRSATDLFLPVSDAVRDGNRVDRAADHKVIPNFVRPLPARPAAGNDRLAMLPREPYILFFGDATEDKGAGRLAAAYRSLASPPPLVFAGRCFVDELRTMPGVVLTGPLPHELAIEAVRQSLFTVAPSVWAEPFGIVAIETAAAGKAIVAADIGGLRDIVIHGQTGLLFNPRDQSALADAMVRLVSDPPLRERLGHEAQRRVASFGPDVVVPQFEHAYRSAIAVHGPAPG